jgi:hypothetical protein
MADIGAFLSAVVELITVGWKTVASLSVHHPFHHWPGGGKKFSAGQSYTMPGHDAWVEGTEPFVGIEVMSAERYAKAD